MIVLAAEARCQQCGKLPIECVVALLHIGVCSTNDRSNRKKSIWTLDYGLELALVSKENDAPKCTDLFKDEVDKVH